MFFMLETRGNQQKKNNSGIRLQIFIYISFNALISWLEFSFLPFKRGEVLTFEIFVVTLSTR